MLSPSSSVNAAVFTLTLTDEGRDELTTSRKGKRKRTMEGFTVEQTTTGAGAFSSHQQQTESGATPPHKAQACYWQQLEYCVFFNLGTR